jgi:hypothetical protein
MIVWRYGDMVIWLYGDMVEYFMKLSLSGRASSETIFNNQPYNHKTINNQPYNNLEQSTIQPSNNLKPPHPHSTFSF